jgi:hypothetical protein
MTRKAKAILAAAALLAQALAPAASVRATETSEERALSGQPLYKPRLDFLQALGRWNDNWNALFPSGQEPPTPAIKTLGEELAQYKIKASHGMTVAELDKLKTSFSHWETRASNALCEVPAVVQSGQDCRTFARQMRSAAGNPRLEAQELRQMQQVAAAAAHVGAAQSRVGAISDATLFDGRTAGVNGAPPAQPGATIGSPAAPVPLPRPAPARSASVPVRSATGSLLSGTSRGRAATAVPLPVSYTSPDDADQGLASTLARKIRNYAVGWWDGKCLTYVWDALTATLKTNLHAILGYAANSAHDFLAALRSAPSLLARLNLHAVNPFNADGQLAFKKGMTIFYDAGVCDFDPKSGHAEIVTTVDAQGRASATSSATEGVRTTCLKSALERGLALVVMPGQAAPPMTPAQPPLIMASAASH